MPDVFKMGWKKWNKHVNLNANKNPIHELEYP